MKKWLIVVVAVAASLLGPVLVAPMASADSLPNGYDVTCTPNGNGQSECVISGCPRVHDDEAGDVIHARFNSQPQQEIAKACGDTIGVTPALLHSTVDASSGFTFSIQGCRKNRASSDDCGAWSTYTYTPPAQPAPTPVVSNAGEPTRCIRGTATSYTLPPGSDCSKTPNPNPPPAPVADVTNAITASFDQPGFSSVDLHVTNSSNLQATCNYTATANSLNPLVPKKTTRQFNVPANGNQTETFNGAPTLTSYDVTLSCSDASGKQKAELGHVVTSVFW